VTDLPARRPGDLPALPFVCPVEDADTIAALDGVALVLTTGEWLRAAVVWAHCTPGQAVRAGPAARSFRTFARLRITGLRSHVTVAHYYAQWQRAIDTGHAKPITPGDPIEVPDLPFVPRAGSREVEPPEPEREHGITIPATLEEAVADLTEAHEQEWRLGASVVVAVNLGKPAGDYHVVKRILDAWDDAAAEGRCPPRTEMRLGVSFDLPADPLLW
jgi:hypothetical protein